MGLCSAKIRVLLVANDAALRVSLALELGKHPYVDVVGTACDAFTAIPKIDQSTPDWVVVDLHSNVVDGLNFLKLLQDARVGSRRAVLLAHDADNDNPAVAQAKAAGVAALVWRDAKQSGHQLVTQLVAGLLVPILRAAGARTTVVKETALAGATASGRAAPGEPLAQPVDSPAFGCRVIGIGASTGGPGALREVLAGLPASCNQPILIVQHMPATFTHGLAQSLDEVCALPVREAVHGEPVVAGQVLLARGGSHMRVERGATGLMVAITDDPPECSCRPSVNYLFRSLVQTFGRSVLGVVLTGMGEDGWLGARAIHNAGGRVLAQDRATSVVYGMPRGPIEAGIARAVALPQMVDAIMQTTGNRLCC